MLTGRFIVFEGIDGSGKTTQIQLLKKRIEKTGIRCLETREPSDGPVGVLIRQCLTGRMEMSEASLAALFAADRIDHLENKNDGIINNINNGITVISDRYMLSNYAYQSVRVPFEWIEGLNSYASSIIKPDCHIFIDVDPDITEQRMASNRFSTELFENKQRLIEVRNKYLELLNKFSQTENIILIDGNQSIEKISDDIWDKVSCFFQ